ncbi:membrane or secreted protein, partial [Flavobacteriaceae bacterium]|nr:membrane or secreted protein [Flavobacteriaceae bacterium]
MEIFLISLVLIAIAFSGIAIKLIFKKDGEFSGTCASQSPFINKSDEP